PATAAQQYRRRRRPHSRPEYAPAGLHRSIVHWLGMRPRSLPQRPRSPADDVVSALCLLPSAIFLLVAPFADRRLERQARIPGKIDPGVLRHLRDERVDQRTPHRLRIDGCKVSIRQEVTDDTRGLSCIDKIIDDQYAFPL